MDSSASMERAAPASPASAALWFSSPRRFRSWLRGLPGHLGAAITVTALFCITVLVIALVYKAPLSIPRERVSAALGLNAVLPVAFAMALYAGLRFYKSLTGRLDPKDPPLLQAIAVDMTLMGLFLVTTYFHFSLKTWVQVINPRLYDDVYFAIDKDLQPVLDLFYWIRINIFELMPGVDAWYQAAFLLMFITGFCSLAITRSRYYPQFCIGVLLTLSIGGLSYLVAPAVGPFIYEAGLNQQATEAQAVMYWAHRQAIEYGMPWIAQAGSGYFTGGLAAMPSLHIAQAVTMTYFILRAGSPLFGLFLFICLWVTVESVASRWHYLIDLPVGLALSVLVIWLSNHLCRERRPAAAGTPDMVDRI
ncbi:MAG: phosphatase PAP2 family protein [Kiloniellaceae bacterium]